MEQKPSSAKPKDPAVPVEAPDNQKPADETAKLLLVEVDRVHGELNIERAKVQGLHARVDGLETELRVEMKKNVALNRENVEVRVQKDILSARLEEAERVRQQDQRTIRNLAKSWEDKNREAYEASFDHVTGLLMPEFFDRKVGEFFQKEKRSIRFAFGFIDLARFKEVNDTFGHVAGDDVLRQVGRITASVRESHLRIEGDRRYLSRKGEYDIASRGGTGDEFVFFVSEVASVPDCRHLAMRVIRGIAQIRVKNMQSLVQGDMGMVTMVVEPKLALSPRQTVYQLRRWADYYMYKAKNYCKGQGLDTNPKNRFAVKDLPRERLFQEPPAIDRSGR